jgi:hypothetical protein
VLQQEELLVSNYLYEYTLGPLHKWHFSAIPLLHMTSIRSRRAYGEDVPAVESHEVDLQSKPYLRLE